MNEPREVGTRPWFPWPLSRWSWWTESVPAERVAALRIVTALVLLVDLFVCHLPSFHTMLSADALGGRDLYAGRFRADHFYWSVLRWLPDSWGPQVVFAVWALAAVGLLVGWRPLVCGLVAWLCAMSVWAVNPALHNGGDRLRHTLLLMTAMSCSGAVWGVSSLRIKAARAARGTAAWAEGTDPRPLMVPGWPVKILFVQLAALYFFSGYYKVISPLWRSGYVMYWASHDLYWSLCPAQSARLPVWVHQLSAWVTLVWELGFPILAAMRGTRAVALVLGVIFHIGTLLMFEVGAFALYSIACYTAFAPWERLSGRTHPLPLPSAAEPSSSPPPSCGLNRVRYS